MPNDEEKYHYYILSSIPISLYMNTLRYVERTATPLYLIFMRQLVVSDSKDQTSYNAISFILGITLGKRPLKWMTSFLIFPRSKKKGG